MASWSGSWLDGTPRTTHTSSGCIYTQQPAGRARDSISIEPHTSCPQANQKERRQCQISAELPTTKPAIVCRKKLLPTRLSPQDMRRTHRPAALIASVELAWLRVTLLKPIERRRYQRLDSSSGTSFGDTTEAQHVLPKRFRSHLSGRVGERVRALPSCLPRALPHVDPRYILERKCTVRDATPLGAGVLPDSSGHY